MSASTLPPCGIYKTLTEIGGVPRGALVHFHNHGNPGPGVYLPEGWSHNRAKFSERGQTLPEPYHVSAGGLAPLPPEGLYRVTSQFHCCEKKCRSYETNQMVQLGYNGDAEAILFVPEWTTGGLRFPEMGSRIDDAAFDHLAPLAVAEKQEAGTRTHAHG